MSDTEQRLNPSMRIEQVIGFSSLVLVVYYTVGQCWQYEIAFDSSWLSAGKKGRYKSESIYYTADAAEREGRQQVKVLLG
jgi:hypothetical protein